MTTLTINNIPTNLCAKEHTPNEAAISVVATSFDDADYYTFCEVCEQNIKSFCYYDEDRGTVYTNWTVGK